MLLEHTVQEMGRRHPGPVGMFPFHSVPPLGKTGVAGQDAPATCPGEGPAGMVRKGNANGRMKGKERCG